MLKYLTGIMPMAETSQKLPGTSMINDQILTQNSPRSQIGLVENSTYKTCMPIIMQ